jgi:hypothetical protein
MNGCTNCCLRIWSSDACAFIAKSIRRRFYEPALKFYIYSLAAVVLLEVAVESLSLAPGNDDPMSYVRAICDFRRLVSSDFNRVLSDVKRSLTETYGCRSVQPPSAANQREEGDDAGGADGSSILLELRLPRDRLVSLQCDHSSGHLGRELQRLLGTKSLTEYLQLSELTVTTDIRSIQ